MIVGRVARIPLRHVGRWSCLEHRGRRWVVVRLGMTRFGPPRVAGLPRGRVTTRMGQPFKSMARTVSAPRRPPRRSWVEAL